MFHVRPANVTCGVINNNGSGKFKHKTGNSMISWWLSQREFFIESNLLQTLYSVHEANNTHYHNGKKVGTKGHALVSRMYTSNHKEILLTAWDSCAEMLRPKDALFAIFTHPALYRGVYKVQCLCVCLFVSDRCLSDSTLVSFYNIMLLAMSFIL